MVQMDLTVWSVCVGDKYDPAYVYALQDAVARNLTIPHTFKCITKQRLDGVETRNPPVPYQSWWSKIGLFYPGLAKGPSIYLDLDTVITGNLDFLADYTDEFSAPANWAQSGHGGIQSSVMCWPGSWHEPFERFKYPEDTNRLWGDQEFLWEMLGDDWQRIPHVGSYKYHCRAGIPDWLRIMCFHGKPDPHEVKDDWILPYTSMLHSRIKSNTANG